MAISTHGPTLRSARQVRIQLGNIAEVTLWRRVNDLTLSFPHPHKILGRNYWLASDIDAWIERQIQPETEAA